MYFTDRGIEELADRRGEEQVTLEWLSDQLRTFVDLNPEFETPIERLASWLARLDDEELDDEAFKLLDQEDDRLIAEAEAQTRESPGGTILAFLPGEGEIRRVAAMLPGMLGGDAEIAPLFGAMDLAAQARALAPPGPRRRIVLATSIAETSLTIPGVRVVVGLGRW